MQKNPWYYLPFFVVILAIFVTPHIYAQEKASESSATPLPKSQFVQDDKRVRLLRGYLASHNSPLAEYSPIFVQKADEHELDWKLMPAISGVESTFGKQIPYNSYNAWGWGIYGNNTLRFTSWEEAIDTISKSLREDYINKWKAQDTYAIGRIYAASPTWAQRVEYFMEKINQYETKNPASALSLSL